jgi:hypothetical protein
MINVSPAAALASSFALSAVLLSSPAAANSPGGQPQFGGPQPGMGVQQMQQNPAVEQFRATLQRFGAFQQHPAYGEVWTPAPGLVPQGWRPYPECHWTYDRQMQAWFFNDQTEWGQIVHHHGRWAFDPQIGFMWIADGNFGPGWVVWRADAQSVSWAAMTPDGQEPGQEFWHTQDARTFNAGCRQSAPAPVASAPPMAPVYAQPRAPIVVATGGPVYAPPVVVQRPPIIVTPPPPVWVPGFCERFPLHPRCRPVVGRPPFNFCDRFPLHPRCRPIVRPRPCPLIFPRPAWCGGPVIARPTPGPLGSLCARFPAHPSCRVIRPGRPGPIVVRPFPGRPPIVRPFPRPGIHVRPNIVRPNFVRPNFARPNFVRPSFSRPSFSRPAMARPMPGLRMARR